MLLLFPSFYSISLFFSFSFFAYYFVSNLISKLQTKKITRNLLAGLLESPKIFNNVSPFYTWIIQWDPTTASWHDERRIANFVFFFFYYMSTAARKNRLFLFTLISITTFVGAWARSKSKNKFFRVCMTETYCHVYYGCFFLPPPSPFCFSLCFFSVTSGTQHACYFHSDDASR